MNEELERIISTVKSLEGEISRSYKANAIGVFGSYARGDQREGSDLDILVNFHQGATLLHLVSLGDFLEEKLRRKVDIVPVDTIRDEIKERVLKEAVYL